MSTYPPGAGPYAGQYAGDVYVPQSGGQAVASDGTTSATRPSIAQAAAAADTAGRMVAAFTAPVTNAWLVRRITIQSTIRSQALVYVGTQIEAANLVSGTIAGNLDENDSPQPYLVPEGQSMFVHWVGGGTCRARIEYQEI